MPGSFAGNLLGAGADLDVARGACANERAPWIDEVGADQVIELDALTPGATYGLVLDSVDDLGFYVYADCGSCVLFDDRTAAGERDTFVAPASGSAMVVVDTALAPSQLQSGAYTLEVVQPLCASDFDCASASAPVCDDSDQCVVGPAQCTGDDADGDDGPAAATPLVLPASVTANICNVPASEADWYAIDASADETVAIDLSWTDASVDLDLFVFDSTGNLVASAQTSGAGPEQLAPTFGAGTYYVIVTQFAPADTAAASAYTLTASAL